MVDPIPLNPPVLVLTDALRTLGSRVGGPPNATFRRKCAEAVREIADADIKTLADAVSRCDSETIVRALHRCTAAVKGAFE